MITPRMRLRAYAPDGASLGLLPTPSEPTVAYPLNDLANLKFSYSAKGPKISLLGQPCEVAVEISPDGGTTWMEPRDSRFLYTADALDPINTKKDHYDIDCKPYVWRLSKAIVLPNGLLNNEGKRAFLQSEGANPGVVMKTLLNEAQARGWATSITHSSWNSTTDSSGAAWSKVLTIYYTPGLDYWTILRNLADQGFIDFHMQGRELKIYNPDAGMSVDRTVSTPPVTLRGGRDLTEAPFKRTWEGLANFAYFAGDKMDYSFTNPGAITPWGRQEIFISNGSVNEPGTAATITQAELSQTDAERTEHTHGLDFGQAAAFPLVDYHVGNYVWSVIKKGLPSRLRVRQLTLTVNNRGRMSGNVVLNDRFLESDLRHQRRVEGITNGASGTATDSGSGTVGGSEIPNSIPPAQVTGLSITSEAYVGPGGFTQAVVRLSWSAVTTNSNGTPILDFDHYEVHDRLSGETASDFKAIVTGTQVDMFGYPAGSPWRWKVRAVDRWGNYGAFSSEIVHTTAADATPPQAPTAPVVTPYLGQLRITWDGQPATGSWPSDFFYVEVHASTTNNFTPDTSAAKTTLVDRMYAKGATVYTNVVYGTPVYVKLVAYDTSHLPSAASAQGSATPARLVGNDISTDAITYEQIAFKDQDNEIVDGSFESTSFQNWVNAHVDKAAAWTFSTADKFHGASAVTINAATNPSTYRWLPLMPGNISGSGSPLVGSERPIEAGQKLFCRMAYKGSTGANGALQLVVQWHRQGASTQWSVLEGTVKNDTWQQAAAQLTAPASTKSYTVYVEVTNGGTSGTYWVDAVEVRRTVGTSIIEDAAITNALIANATIQDAKIANVAAGKIVAGTITSDLLVAGSIKTSSSGARVEMTSTGIRMYDASNVLKAHLDPSVGQLRLFSTDDGTHTSTGHAIQLGPSNAKNLILDDNEIMARENGSYATLHLNREGGLVYIGGKVGGFPGGDPDEGVIPHTDDHRVYLRASTHCWNVRNSNYNDELPPLLVGTRGSTHLWLDNHSIGATGSGGDSPGALYLMPKNGGVTHNAQIIMASEELHVERVGTDNAGMASNAGADAAVQWQGGAIRIRTNGYGAYQEIVAQAFTVGSSMKLKKDVTEFDALDIVKNAPSRKWRYKPEFARKDSWHFGPMAEELPEELIHLLDDPTPIPEDQTPEQYQHVDIGAIAGVAWEAVRQLSERVEALETGR